ncbi:MAG TPA: hypothetical protein VK694_06055 [Verrucomicrobiae bacterium]|nr:hypothetical protein [Verrucomicrobiae bacterium]
MTTENAQGEYLHAPQDKLTTGPGGYQYGDAFPRPEGCEDNEIFDHEYWGYMKELLAGSFVVSSGRQYDQFNAQVLGAMELLARGIYPDYEVIGSQDIVAAVRTDELPKHHTKSPANIAGQVAGVYHFWWLAQTDAVRLLSDPDFELPTRQQIEDRYEKVCGVKIGETSSTTWEEMEAIHSAFGKVREDPEVSTMGPDQFALRHCLPSRFGVLIHWAVHNRPRLDRGTDRHEPRWRTSMLAAAAKPPDQRGLYDAMLLREARAVKELLVMGPDELAKRECTDLLNRHNRAIDLLNQRGGEQLTTIIDGVDLSEPTARRISTVPPAVLLGEVLDVGSF